MLPVYSQVCDLGTTNFDLRRCGGRVTAMFDGLEIFGADRVPSAWDAPFDPDGGSVYIEDTVRIIKEIDISGALRQKILQDNAVAPSGLRL